MRPLAIAFVVLMVVAYSNMALIDSLENNEYVGDPVDGTAAVDKRDTDKEETSLETFNNFIEEKLMQQSQALEHLITMVDSSGDMIKKLIQNLSKGLEKPKLPTKAEVDEVPVNKNKHNNVSVARIGDHPIIKLGKHIPKISKLAADLMLKDHSATDPTPLIEQDTDGPLLALGSRRSFGGNPITGPSQRSDDSSVNPWCPIALLCQKTVEPVCGFDDVFGYGKFEDLCHLLRVNCYWKYNFSVVYSCRPKL